MSILAGVKAFKLINTADNQSDFLEGTIPLMTRIAGSYFFAQTQIDAYELRAHPAPRYQFVITLKGKLRFTVSNGSSFIIEPGIILIAADLAGKGHTWELIGGEVWERIYIVPSHESEGHFRVGEK